MSKVVIALKLSKLSIPQKIEFGRVIITSMTGNANFTTPSPALTVLATNVNALETASIAAKSGGRDETALMYVKEQVLDLSLKSLGAYIEATANSNFLNAEAIALSAGINLRKERAPRVNGFRLQAAGQGEIQLRTDSDPRAIFTWAITETPADENSWVVLHASTRAQYLATGLESGTRYSFRFAKTGKDGQEPWSHVLDLICT